MIFQSSTGQPITPEMAEMLPKISELIIFMENYQPNYAPGSCLPQMTPKEEHMLNFFMIYSQSLRTDLKKISPESLPE